MFGQEAALRVDLHEDEDRRDTLVDRSSSQGVGQAYQTIVRGGFPCKCASLGSSELWSPPCASPGLSSYRSWWLSMPSSSRCCDTCQCGATLLLQIRDQVSCADEFPRVGARGALRKSAISLFHFSSCTSCLYTNWSLGLDARQDPELRGALGLVDGIWTTTKQAWIMTVACKALIELFAEQRVGNTKSLLAKRQGILTAFLGAEIDNAVTLDGATCMVALMPTSHRRQVQRPSSARPSIATIMSCGEVLWMLRWRRSRHFGLGTPRRQTEACW